jgi:hypothetical protein
MTTNNISLNLLENGMDFIIRGLDELYELDDDYEYERYIFPSSKPQKDYKYGILHLYSGFLLLLKERLFRDSPDSIYINPASKTKTINYTVSLTKLENLASPVTFTPADKAIIDKIQEYRNCFEHYVVTNLDVDDLSKVIVSFIDLIYKFLINHLGIDLSLNPFSTDPKTIAKILSIESIYNHIIDKRKSEITLLGEEKVNKFKTVEKSVLKQLEEESQIYFDETGEDGDSFGICPKCEKDTLIIDGEFQGVCSNKKCYTYTPLKNCNKCGAIMEGYEWIEEWCSMCDEEMDRIMENDRW